MTVRIDTKTFDLAAYIAAIEGRDPEGQVAAFSDGAELMIVDHEHTPSNPLTLRGADALRVHFADVCGRDMTHKVITATASDDRLTVELACRYADGARVACISVSSLTDGRITSQRGLQVWDH